MKRKIMSLAIATSLASTACEGFCAPCYAIKEVPKSRTFKSNNKRSGTASAKRRAKKNRNIKRSKK